MEVTNVVSVLPTDICDELADSIELDIVLKTLDEIVDSSGNTTELVTSVDSSCKSVEISGKSVVLFSLFSVDDNLS
jgi:hypothetical protein